jgi:hypothetical protein
MLLSKDGKKLRLCSSILTSSSLVVPSSVETISSYALYNATSKHVYFHENVKSVEDNVFSSNLQRIEIESTNNNFTLDDKALYSKDQKELIVVIDKSVDTFDIPSTVTKIYGSAFAYCDIGTLNIGAGVSSIQNNTFDYMKVANIVVSGSNSNFKSDSNVAILNKGGTILYKYANENTKTSYTIPTTVSTIEKLAFYNADKLTSVSLPTNLKNINEGAFSYCGGLSSITLPSGITSTAYQAFYPSSITTVNISGSVGPEAFANCMSLTSATVSNNANVLDTAIFKNCESLSTIEFKQATPPVIYGDLFEGMGNSFSIKVPNSAKTIYSAVRPLFAYIAKIVGE